MFLTHLDAEGNASPAILIDNATAANRAVNIPEFVNIPPDGMMKIDVPAAESYRLVDVASELTAKGQTEEAIADWKKVIELDPAKSKAYIYIGELLMWQGKSAEATKYLQKGRELDPDAARTEVDLGLELSYREQFNAAIESADCKAAASYGKEILAVVPDDSEVNQALANCVLKQDRQ
jgi:tetratricopeptide (TPR) repeat protein